MKKKLKNITLLIILTMPLLQGSKKGLEPTKITDAEKDNAANIVAKLQKKLPGKKSFFKRSEEEKLVKEYQNAKKKADLYAQPQQQKQTGKVSSWLGQLSKNRQEKDLIKYDNIVRKVLEFDSKNPAATTNTATSPLKEQASDPASRIIDLNFKITRGEKLTKEEEEEEEEDQAQKLSYGYLGKEYEFIQGKDPEKNQKISRNLEKALELIRKVISS